MEHKFDINSFLQVYCQSFELISSCCISGCKAQITVTQTPSVKTVTHKKMLRWAVNSVVVTQPAVHPVCPGTYRNLEKLLNSWFIGPKAFSQELHLDSVAGDLTKISLWPSVESRLKMLDIITVWKASVVQCSHSDKESYKNLRQSESRWLNWSCSCSNTITHYWHTETNTATTHELKTELRVKSAPLDCDLSCDRRVWLSYAMILI